MPKNSDPSKKVPSKEEGTGHRRRRRQKPSSILQQLRNIIRIFMQMPLFIQVLIIMMLLVLLTNHTALSDLINLIKVIKA